MFNSDNPITLRSEDELGRDGFCKHFTNQYFEISFFAEPINILLLLKFADWIPD